MSIAQTIERIRSYAAHMGWKRNRLAKEADIQRTTLRNFHHDDWNPTRETLEKLERVIPADFVAPSKPKKSKRVTQ